MERDDLLPQTLDDDAAWMAYADWLQSRGEPQGELIAVDIALEQAQGAQQEKLLVARKDLVARYGAAILGETFARFLAAGYALVEWRRGYITQFAYTGSYSVSHKRAVGWLVKLIEDKPEPFRFVQELGFANTDLASLEPFARFAHLETIDVLDSKVGLEAVRKFRALRPNVKVRYSQPGT